MGTDFRVGAWLVQPSLNTVSRDGASVHLQPKVMEVLMCLAHQPGEAIPKDQLLKTVWPDTFVTDDVLIRSISELRRVFEDDAREPTIIQTIPKRGYRLVAPVEWVNGTPASSADYRPETHGAVVNARTFRMGALAVMAAALLLVFLGANIDRLRARLAGQSGAPQIRSLAVLPLQNLSNDTAQEYFSDGMTDALITDLAQIGSVKVISRTSSSQYKQTKKSLPEIARELNVDGIVEGTVQRSGDRVRITAQLIHGPSDKHLWANTYERDTRDFFALERDVTADIARQIQVRLRTRGQAALAQPRPVSPKVLEAYLQGSYHLDKYGKGGGEEMKRAAECFQQAIDADPNFAPAYDGLATSHYMLPSPSSQDAQIAQRAEEKAVQLDPNFANARVMLAVMKWNKWDFHGAEEELRQVLALNPNNPNAHDQLGGLLATMGRPDEGLRECQVAQQLDPMGDHLRDALYLAGEYDRAIAEGKRVLQSDPNNGFVHDGLYRYYATKGMYKEASQEAEKVMVLFGYPDVAARVHQALVTSGGREAIRQYAKEVERLMREKRGYLPGHVAEIYAILGDKERAFYWLETNYKHYDTAAVDAGLGLQDLKINHMLDSLHSDPRYKDLVRRVGLPE